MKTLSTIPTVRRTLCWSAVSIVFVMIAMLPSRLMAQPSVSNPPMVDTPQEINGTPGTNGGDKIKYDVTVTNSGSGDATGVTYQNTVDPNTTLDNTSIQTTPIAVNESYTTTGNVTLTINAASGVLANDFDADLVGPALTVSAGATSANGGNVALNANGSFTYSPPAGFEGSDNFTYTLNDDEGNTDVATVTITVSGMIWFIDNNAPSGGDGRLATPFNTLAAFHAINDGAGNHPAAGDNIFIYESATSYVGPVTLLNNQRLIGQDATSSLSTLTGLTNNSSAFPAMNSANGTKVTITSSSNDVNLAQNNRLHGMTLGNATGSALNGSSFGTLTTADVAVNTNGQALNLTTGTISGDFTGVTSTGGTNNVSLTTVATSGTVSLGGGTLSGASGASFNVNGGTGSFTYTGGITQGNNAAMVNVTGGHTGTITFSTGTLSATNGTGLQFDNADGTYNFNGTNTLNGGNAGIDILNGSSGTFSFSSNSSITNPSGDAFEITGSNCNVTYSGSITDNGGYVVDIDNHDGGTVTFQTGTITSTGTGLRVINSNGGTVNFNNPTKTLTTTTNTAVDLTTSNTGGTVNFGNGGLVINTTTGVGFNATGGGTVNVSGSGNKINDVTGPNNTNTNTALNVTGTTIGASGLTFESISSSAGSGTGIILDNTGTTAGLTVTGDGSNTSVGGNASGGTIKGKSGADGSTSAGIGVYLNNTRSVVLRRMTLNGTKDNFGIRGISVTNFTLEYSTITGSNGTSTALDEGSLNFDNLLGSSAVTNCVIEGGLEDNLNLVNTSGTLDRLTVSGSTFGFNNSTNGNNNILIESQNAGTTLKFTIQSCTIKGARADWLNVSCNSSSTMDAVIGGASTLANTFDNLGSNAHSNAAAGGNRLVLGSVGNLTFDVNNNTLKGSKGEAIRVRSTASGAVTGTATGFVRNNTIGVAGTANSGSTEGSGIFVFGDGGSDMTISITGNNVYQYNNHGIRLDFGDEINDGSSFAATVTGNTVASPGNINTDFNGFHLNNGTVGATDNFTTCLHLSGNTLTGSGSGSVSPNNQEFRLRQRQSTTVKLPGYGGTNNNDAAVVTFLRGQNTVTAGNGAASNTVGSGGGGFIGGTACPTP